MQQHIARPKRPTAVALAYPSGRSSPSPVLTMTMHQPVSSSASPVFIATPTGRSSTMLATSKTEFSTPIFSLPSNIGVCEKAVNSFSPALRGVSPTSVATSLATPRMGGISREPRLPGGIVGIRRSYDHGSPSSEKVFEPVDRESQRRVPMPMPMTCSPCRNINQDDTADVDVTSPTAAASVASSPHITGSAPFLKLRKGGDRLGGSSNRSSHGRRRASTSTLSPASASPTPQNLKDNPERLAKVKTEMCRYYELGGLKNCPWGDKCKFELVHTRYHCDV